MTAAADETLVKAACAGDTRAFGLLVDRYAAAVRAVAFHWLRDRHLSEDVAQNVFVLSFRKLHNLRAPALFGRWVLRIARHEAQRTRQSRREPLPLEYAFEAVAGAESTDIDSERLLDAVMRLPVREQRVIMLRFFNDHSINEIAKITGRPVGTVTKQLSRGYEKLRELLAEIAL